MGGTRVALGTLMPGLAGAALRAAERGFAVAVHAMGNVGSRPAG